MKQLAVGAFAIAAGALSVAETPENIDSEQKLRQIYEQGINRWQDPQWTLLLAEISRKLGYWPQAQALLSHRLQSNVDNALVLNSLAEVLQAQGEEAISRQIQLLVRREDNLPPYLEDYFNQKFDGNSSAHQALLNAAADKSAESEKLQSLKVSQLSREQGIRVLDILLKNGIVTPESLPKADRLYYAIASNDKPEIKRLMTEQEELPWDSRVAAMRALGLLTMARQETEKELRKPRLAISERRRLMKEHAALGQVAPRELFYIDQAVNDRLSVAESKIDFYFPVWRWQLNFGAANEHFFDDFDYDRQSWNLQLAANGKNNKLVLVYAGDNDETNPLRGGRIQYTRLFNSYFSLGAEVGVSERVLQNTAWLLGGEKDEYQLNANYQSAGRFRASGSVSALSYSSRSGDFSVDGFQAVADARYSVLRAGPALETYASAFWQEFDDDSFDADSLIPASALSEPGKLDIPGLIDPFSRAAVGVMVSSGSLGLTRKPLATSWFFDLSAGYQPEIESSDFAFRGQYIRTLGKRSDVSVALDHFTESQQGGESTQLSLKWLYVFDRI